MIERISALWSQGLTMTQIANELGTNKNVIAGHIHRARRSGIHFDARPQPSTKKKAVGRGPTSGLDHPIMHLKRNSCRFILNDDTAKPVYCCEPIVEKSYCSVHLKQCYYPVYKAGRTLWRINF